MRKVTKKLEDSNKVKNKNVKKTEDREPSTEKKEKKKEEGPKEIKD